MSDESCILPGLVDYLKRGEIMEKLVERAGKAEVEIEKLYAEFERLQKLQPEEGETPEELVRFVGQLDFLPNLGATS